MKKCEANKIQQQYHKMCLNGNSTAVINYHCNLDTVPHFLKTYLLSLKTCEKRKKKYSISITEDVNMSAVHNLIIMMLFQN